jgi:hypothetical protein
MELFRLVDLPAPGLRPVVVRDMQDRVIYLGARGTLKVAPGQSQSLMAEGMRRYQGSRQVGERRSNGTVARVLLVKGADADEVLRNAEHLVADCASPNGTLHIEWLPDGATDATYYEVRGAPSIDLRYEWVQFKQGKSMEVEVTWPVAPLARELDMDIVDRFTFADDSLSDYEQLLPTWSLDPVDQDSGETGQLFPDGALADERRALHTARGHEYHDHEVQVLGVVGAVGPVPGYKLGVILKYVDVDNFIECYVDDNGANSRLRIDVVLGGVRTNRASVNLAARLAQGEIVVAGRIEKNKVVAEFNLNDDTHQPIHPRHTAALVGLTTTSYDLAGADLDAFGRYAGTTTAVTNGEPIEGSHPSGRAGWSWIPQHADSTINAFYVSPFTYKTVMTPLTIAAAGEVPGSAPALCRTDLSHGDNVAAVWPAWGLVSATKRRTEYAKKDAGDTVPFGVLVPTNDWPRTNFTYAANEVLWTPPVAGGNGDFNVLIDPSLLFSDDFVNFAMLELWASVSIPAALSNVRVAPYVLPSEGSGYAQPVYADPFHSIGTLLPDTTATAWRTVRLGNVPVPIDAARRRLRRLYFGFVSGPNPSAAQVKVRHVYIALASHRLAGDTGKANDSTYARLFSSANVMTRGIYSDGAGEISADGAAPVPDHGLRGALELRPGSFDAMVKLSELVPGDPTLSASSEQATHVAAVHFAVTPRRYLARG